MSRASSAPPHVLLSGGGSGGHLVPGLALARQLVASGARVSLVRPGRAIEDAFDHSCLRAVHALPASRNPITLARSTWQARRLLAREGIDVVVGLGGGGSLPAALAAIATRRPLVLLEQNVVPGRANQRLARFARRVYAAFEATRALLPNARDLRVVGVPLDRVFLHAALSSLATASSSRGEAASGDPLSRSLEDQPRPRPLDHGEVGESELQGARELSILVVGGSQGARALNLGVPELLAAARDRVSVADGDAGAAALRITHITGPGKLDETRAAYAGAGLEAELVEFSSSMPALYAQADLVVCRGGGTTLAELQLAGCPAVVVPYPHHKDRHQELNALEIERSGAARMLLEGDFEARGREVFGELLSDPDLRARMRSAARANARPDAAQRIVADLHQLAAGRAPLRAERAQHA